MEVCFLSKKEKKKVTINAYKKIYKIPPLKAPTNKARPDLEAHFMTKYFHECIYDLSQSVLIQFHSWKQAFGG